MSERITKIPKDIYLLYKNLDTKISKYDDKLIVLKNDTENII